MVPDLYHGDHIDDFDALKESIGGDFVIFKATQGTGFIDPVYANRADWANAKGVPHWAYTFMENADGEAQAQFLYEHSDRPVGYVLDCEPYKGDAPTREQAEAACRWFAERGLKCMVYWMDSQADLYGGIAESVSPELCADWVARYGRDIGKVDRYPAHFCDLHQFTSVGHVAGVGNVVDLSRVTGQGKTLAWFRGEDGMKGIADWMETACEEWSLGYDQSNRWDIRDGGETDCSALGSWCCWKAGYTDDPEPENIYSGNIVPWLKSFGFYEVKLGERQRNDVLVAENHHVAVCLSHGKIGQASIDERGRTTGGRFGDQSGRETNVKSYYDYPWTCCLRAPDGNGGGKEDEMQLSDAVTRPDGHVGSVNDILSYVDMRVEKMEPQVEALVKKTTKTNRELSELRSDMDGISVKLDKLLVALTGKAQ